MFGTKSKCIGLLFCFVLCFPVRRISYLEKKTRRKGGEIQDTKILNLLCNIVSLQVFVDVSRFSPGAINLMHNKKFVAG